MKKIFLITCLACCTAGTLISCDNETDKPNVETIDAADLDYSADYAASWANYSRNVAALLRSDASRLAAEWTGGFAQRFKSGDFSGSHNGSIQQILDGCIDIANEVGTAKIGEPFDYWQEGKQTTAVYAVESWYSWHSRDDYANNIKSIAQSLLGQRFDGRLTAESSREAAPNSLLNYCAALEPAATKTLWESVVAASDAILAIPQPFRNNIGSSETVAAMEACSTLTEHLEAMKAVIAAHDDEAGMEAVVAQYVDSVVLPTYAELARRNSLLYDAVAALGNNPSNAAFASACEAWLAAREPWETSEAFLFGPVDELGLDPNMDSWPLDQDAIVKILTSGDFDQLQWADDDDDDAIEAAQSLRGFHTLEFLLFKNGSPRTIH